MNLRNLIGLCQKEGKKKKKNWYLGTRCLHEFRSPSYALGYGETREFPNKTDGEASYQPADLAKSCVLDF